jgi:hypothetical protein
MTLLKTLSLSIGLTAISVATLSAAIVTTPSTDATALATGLAGAGVVISNAQILGQAEVGTFTGGSAAGIGFESGVILTTGLLSCVPGPNTSQSCSGDGVGSELSFDFTTATGSLFFTYTFGSEEYNEFVGSGFNDGFELLLTGPTGTQNIAVLPDGTVVTINSVNNSINSAFYRDNDSGAIDAQYDGFTTVLQASALNLTAGQVYNFRFRVFDVGDSSYDSGVFLQAGSFSGEPTIPEPSTYALCSGGLALAAFLRCRRVGKGK